MSYEDDNDFFEDDNYIDEDYAQQYDPGCGCEMCVAWKQQVKSGIKNPIPRGRFERTLILMKPDAVKRGLVGEVMSRFEKSGFRLIASKMLKMDVKTLKYHYSQHVEKNFWPDLVEFFMSGPVMATVWQGEHVCQKTRETIGPTKHPSQCAPGTIRGTYAISFPNNVVHGSDDPRSAHKEIKTFFTMKEIEAMDVMAEAVADV